MNVRNLPRLIKESLVRKDLSNDLARTSLPILILEANGALVHQRIEEKNKTVFRFFIHHSTVQKRINVHLFLFLLLSLLSDNFKAIIVDSRTGSSLDCCWCRAFGNRCPSVRVGFWVIRGTLEVSQTSLDEFIGKFTGIESRCKSIVTDHLDGRNFFNINRQQDGNKFFD
jgi:hypothetical protein